ncbi:MAG: metallophosphoesterase [Candidatus Riflebacteria bacterium]|nr:metallophosphoesterase [Candidatus Riflebacteria bacterium]
MRCRLILAVLGSLLVVSTALPALAAATATLTIAVISDLNDAYGSTTFSPEVETALRHIEEVRPDLVLCVGDMVAGQKASLTEDNLKAMWEGFEVAVLRRLSRAGLPLAFTFGNHDGPDTPSFARERRVARTFWQSRRQPLAYVDARRYPENYSFTLGGIFFAVLDASTATLSQTQRDWLTVQLSRDAARHARVRVVLGHLPLYALADGRNRPGDVLADADGIHAWFCRLGIDYYLSGHHHAFFPSRKGSLRMIGAGALGGGPRPLLGSDRPPAKTLTFLSLGPTGKRFRTVTFQVTDHLRVIPLSDLPSEVHGFNGLSVRDDPAVDGGCESARESETPQIPAAEKR